MFVSYLKKEYGYETKLAEISFPQGIYDGITMLGSNFQLYLEAINRLDISCIMVP